MQIHWFSPLLPDPTDIGHFTGRVLEHLSRLAKVTVWTTTKNPLQGGLPAAVKINHFDMEAPGYEPLSRGIILYNIGNNGPFHSDIFRMSQRFPGVVVLHEADLQGLFSYLWLRRDPTGKTYVEYLQEIYGRVGELYAKARLRGIQLEGLAHHYPIVKPALANALGVVSHTSQVSQLARNACLPFTQLNLPYSAGKQTSRPNRQDRIRLVQFGYLNPHRKIDDILEAMSRHPDRHAVHFQIFGRLWDETHVKRRIAELGLEDTVKLMGFVDESTLDEAIARCDMVFNLRYPTIGEASGTQLRIWRNGAPSMVTNDGWFGQLPEGSVIKVRPGEEIEQVKQVVSKLVLDRTHFDGLGMIGNDILRSRHNPAEYANGLLEFVSQFDR